MKFSFIYPFRFRSDNARVYQQISMNLDMTVGQAACRLLCRYKQTGFPQMLTRNSLKMSSKFPKFHKNSLDFAQSSV